MNWFELSEQVIIGIIMGFAIYQLVQEFRNPQDHQVICFRIF